MVGERERAADVYLETLRRMEPDIAAVDLTGAAASIAISLKRIADAHVEILEFVRRCSPR